MAKGLKRSLHGERLKSLGLFRRRLRGGLFALCNFLMRERGGAGSDLFTPVTSDRA